MRAVSFLQCLKVCEAGGGRGVGLSVPMTLTVGTLGLKAHFVVIHSNVRYVHGHLSTNLQQLSYKPHISGLLTCIRAVLYASVYIMKLVMPVVTI